MFRQHKTDFSSYIRWTLLSLLAGALSGLAATLFLFLVDLATQVRLAHPIIIFALPFAGLATGWAYHRFGKDINAGQNLIINEVEEPKQRIPLRMTPFILLATVATHLFGGSAGREGTATQMGASLADFLNRLFKTPQRERRVLLVAGAGAGFGAAIGAPFAGIIFGMEVIAIGRLRLFALYECTLASLTAYGVSRLLHAPHFSVVIPEIPDFTGAVLGSVVIAGVAFGLTAKLFSLLTHSVERVQKRIIPYPPLRPALGGVLIVLLFMMESTYRYAGLGLSVIQDAFLVPASVRDPFIKSVFTALTVGSGFKGGEFVPLVFVGTTLGNTLAMVLPLSFAFLAALGFAAVFAGASNAPLACSIMAVELFGWPLAPYALLACYVSYLCSGHRGIYPSQRVQRTKWEQATGWPRTLWKTVRKKV